KNKANSGKSDPPPSPDNWLDFRASNVTKLQKDVKDLTEKLNQANKDLQTAKNELAERDKTIQEQIEKLAKANGSGSPKDDPKKPKKDTEPKKDPPGATDADKERAAANKLDSAKIKYQNGKRDEALKLLKVLIEDYPGTKVIDEAKKLKEKWEDE